MRKKEYTVAPQFKEYVNMERNLLPIPIDEIKINAPPKNNSHATSMELEQLRDITLENKLPPSIMKVADKEPLRLFTALCKKNNLEPFTDEATQYKEEWNKIAFDLKLKFKRPRPWELAAENDIELRSNKTSSTESPSYPSGHAMMGYGLAEFYKEKYPYMEKQWDNIAEVIAHSRLQSGVHYPSDVKASKQVVDWVSSNVKTSSQRLRTTIFGVDPEGKLLHGFGGQGFYKFPGGGVDPGESIADAAKRELLEEAGYSVNSIEELPGLDTSDSVGASSAKGYMGHGSSLTKYLLARLGERDESLLGSEGDAISNLRTAPIDEVLQGLEGDMLFGSEIAGSNYAALNRIRQILNKTAADSHVETRRKQRAKFLDPKDLKKVESRVRAATDLPDGANYITLPHGRKAVVRTNKGKSHLATILGPAMRPPGKDVSSLIKEANTNSILKTLEKVLTKVKAPQLADSVGLYRARKTLGNAVKDLHRYNELTARFGQMPRIVIPKTHLDIKDLKRLGFRDSLVAVPEIGQKTWTTYRHPLDKIHLHDHGDLLNMHIDSLPSLQMLAKRRSMPMRLKKKLLETIPEGIEVKLKSSKKHTLADTLKNYSAGIGHAILEGGPGYINYGVKQLNPWKIGMAEEILSKLPKDYLKKRYGYTRKLGSLSKQANDLSVLTAVPKQNLDLIMRKGLASQKAISEDPELTEAFLRQRDLKEEDWRKELSDALKGFKAHSRLGASVFFSEPDPDKVSDPRHFINQFDTTKLRVNLGKLLKDIPETRFHGVELEPFNEEAWEADPDNYPSRRHRDLTTDEIASLIAKDPKELWKDYKDEYIGKLYAGDVPHGMVLTPSGIIPPEYLEQVEKTSSAKEQLKHILVTGHSGAGKSTYAKELAEELGMPRYRLDVPAGPIMEAEYPGYWDDGTMGYPKDVSTRILQEALGLDTPHVIEGSHMLEVPELTEGYKRILVDTPEDRVVEQRAQREYRNQGRKGKPHRPIEEHRDSAKELVNFYRDLVSNYRGQPGVESIVPEVKTSEAKRLYHGSPLDLEELELRVPPNHEAYGVPGEPGVYAADNPIAAALYALARNKSKGSWGVTKDNRLLMKDYKQLNPEGYVYELDSSDNTPPPEDHPALGYTVRDPNIKSKRKITAEDFADYIDKVQTKEQFLEAIENSKTAEDQPLLRHRSTLLIRDPETGKLLAANNREDRRFDDASPFYFPGGGLYDDEYDTPRNPTEGEILEGARREALEELGISLTNPRVVGGSTNMLPQKWRDKVLERRGVPYVGGHEHLVLADKGGINNSLYNVEGDAFTKGEYYDPQEVYDSLYEYGQQGGQFSAYNVEQAKAIKEHLLNKTAEDQPLLRHRSTLLVRDPETGKLLAAKETDPNSKASPYYFPGGGLYEDEYDTPRTPTEEDVLEGARREALEELGIELDNPRVVGTFGQELEGWWKEKTLRNRGVPYLGGHEHYVLADKGKEDRSLYNVEGDAFEQGEYHDPKEIYQALTQASKIKTDPFAPFNREQARAIKKHLLDKVN